MDESPTAFLSVFLWVQEPHTGVGQSFVEGTQAALLG